MLLGLVTIFSFNNDISIRLLSLCFGLKSRITLFYQYEFILPLTMTPLLNPVGVWIFSYLSQSLIWIRCAYTTGSLLGTSYGLTVYIETAGFFRIAFLFKDIRFGFSLITAVQVDYIEFGE